VFIVNIADSDSGQTDRKLNTESIARNSNKQSQPAKNKKINAYLH